MAKPAYRTIIAAHRGGAALWPENSMTAFRGALGLAVEQIETDIHLSADGEPFILHDTRLDRTTHASGIAGALSWRELAQIRLRGTESDTIPHLDELLALIGPTRMGLRLELKPDAEGAADLRLFRQALMSLQRARLAARTTFTSFDLRYVAEVIASGLGAGHIWLVDRSLVTGMGVEAVLDQARDAGVQEIGIHAGQVAPSIAAGAAARGLRLGLWAVNDPATIEAALRLPATAFTTDHPDVAVKMRSRIA